MNTIETMGFPAIIPCCESLANKEVVLHQALVYIMVSINLNYNLVWSKSPIITQSSKI